ncbi:MAG: hypothetical protein GF317_00530 [Candidatus Lokiarchaeota archaeon]|nr:hypothetical protein [Candidatus Lokiarchaeota archaeon]MBD3198462.1 hypothetical protein [Candidatus Lokiarchaeota archaeon]
MGYSPPKKITVIISFILLAFGLFFTIAPVFLATEFYSIFPPINVGTFSSFEMYLLIGVILVFCSWLLLIIGVNARGI